MAGHVGRNVAARLTGQRRILAIAHPLVESIVAANGLQLFAIAAQHHHLATTHRPGTPAIVEGRPPCLHQQFAMFGQNVDAITTRRLETYDAIRGFDLDIVGLFTVEHADSQAATAQANIDPMVVNDRKGHLAVAFQAIGGRANPHLGPAGPSGAQHSPAAHWPVHGRRPTFIAGIDLEAHLAFEMRQTSDPARRIALRQGWQGNEQQHGGKHADNGFRHFRLPEWENGPRHRRPTCNQRTATGNG